MKRIYLLLLMACMYCSSASAQNIDTSEIESFDEILVSSQRFAQKRSESPRQIEVLSSKSLTELVPATLGDALISSGKVFVQKNKDCKNVL
jgi:outer membrane cobalamin receptor